MANEKNLKRGNPETQFKSGREAVENGRKGGIASGESKREKKTIQNILNDWLEQDCDKIPQTAKLAKKIGIDGNSSLKQLFALAAILKSIENTSLSQLEQLSNLLGEHIEGEGAEEKKQEALLDAIQKAVQDGN